MTFKETIGRNLTYLRNMKNLSPTQLGEVLNITRQAYSNYEKGNRDISAEALKVLANYYGVTLDLITSSTLIDASQPVITFQSIAPNNDSFEFKTLPLTVTNINSSLMAVKYNELLIKIFETNTSYIPDVELLFEFKDKLYIAKIDYLPNGDGIFYHNGKPIHITKQQNKSLVYIGTLLATINKEYENDNFF